MLCLSCFEQRCIQPGRQTLSVPFLGKISLVRAPGGRLHLSGDKQSARVGQWTNDGLGGKSSLEQIVSRTLFCLTFFANQVLMAWDRQTGWQRSRHVRLLLREVLHGSEKVRPYTADQNRVSGSTQGGTRTRNLSLSIAQMHSRRRARLPSQIHYATRAHCTIALVVLNLFCRACAVVRSFLA